MPKLTSAQKLENKKKKVALKVERKLVQIALKEEKKLLEVQKKSLEAFHKKPENEKEHYYSNPKRESGDLPYNNIDDSDDFYFKSKFVKGDFVNDSAKKDVEVLKSERTGKPLLLLPQSHGQNSLVREFVGADGTKMKVY